MDVSALESKLHKLDHSLSKLAGDKHAEKLLSLVHRPGWTTPAEAALVSAMIDALQHQIDGRCCSPVLAQRGG